jgi:uncharacterized membrane protein
VGKLTDYLWIFFISLLPIVELRGAIPAAAILDLPWYSAYILSVIGNMLPVPFILLLSRVVLKWMKNSRVKLFNKFETFLENKIQKGAAKIMKYASFGLLLFVAIPFPGTGAWTGALIAAVMNMRFKYALPMIFLGVLTAGVIMTLASYGSVGLFKIFLG